MPLWKVSADIHRFREAPVPWVQRHPSLANPLFYKGRGGFKPQRTKKPDSCLWASFPATCLHTNDVGCWWPHQYFWKERAWLSQATVLSQNRPDLKMQVIGFLTITFIQCRWREVSALLKCTGLVLFSFSAELKETAVHADLPLAIPGFAIKNLSTSTLLTATCVSNRASQNPLTMISFKFRSISGKFPLL